MSSFAVMDTRKISLVCLFLCLAARLWAGGDTLSVDRSPARKSGGGFLGGLYEFVKDFSRVDTNYIEPQHYNYTLMLQNTNTYEVYRLQSRAGQSVTFSPEPTYKLGPYVGWRWVFLGYTLDLTHSGGSRKQDFSLSLYSSQIGIDLFFRKTGNDYKVNRLRLGEGVDTSPIENMPFDGFRASINGFNLYYITNHRKFSYPAAYSQSTVQRRSCGSPLFGVSYSKHKLDVDWQRFLTQASERMGGGGLDGLDSSLTVGKVSYKDVSVSGGYAYNWVFARNCLFDISLSLAVAYKHTKGDLGRGNFIFRNFDLKNFNLDGVGRFGLVWNNTRWYAGTSAVFHTYNYRHAQFYTNSTFGSVNFYVGFNFGKR